MKQLKLGATGDTTDDLVIALEEALRLVRKGYLSGFGSNDTDSFDFQAKETED